MLGHFRGACAAACGGLRPDEFYFAT